MEQLRVKFEENRSQPDATPNGKDQEQKPDADTVAKIENKPGKKAAPLRGKATKEAEEEEEEESELEGEGEAKNARESEQHGGKENQNAGIFNNGSQDILFEKILEG